MKCLIAIWALCLTALPVNAVELFIPDRIDTEAAFTLSRAEQVIELVRKERPITLGDGEGERLSDLRVSLVVLDNGPATDVSPRFDLHLAMFNVIEEHATAWALEPVTALYRFETVERKAAGIYTVTGILSAGQADCPFSRSQITIDARQLSVETRRATGIEQFDTRRVRTPLTLAIDHLGCTDR